MVSDIKMFTLPTQNDTRMNIEAKLLEFMKKYRDNEPLDEIEISWMDQANTWLG